MTSNFKTAHFLPKESSNVESILIEPSSKINYDLIEEKLEKNSEREKKREAWGTVEFAWVLNNNGEEKKEEKIANRLDPRAEICWRLKQEN
ncbi:hypothetical protein MTR_1g023665 [Medicago truncatula]|uniref:Uncharacterized protein n=1 Tax=Medicago truncatula TaxID=3880 RepID=A0A072VF17_MEDTR|nr:hypothetical protein MTR_1g023665 [Medicago truncatula]